MTGSHFDAIEAQLRLALAQLMAAREHHDRITAQADAVPTIRFVMPEKCQPFDPRKCMLQDGEAANCGLTEMCRACGDVRGVM